MDKHIVKILLSATIFFVPFAASAATLSLTPGVVSVHAGDTFTERVVVSSSDQAANAISGTLSFPSDLVSVASVSKSGSILTLWVQDPSFSNSAGTVDWSGVVPNPGYAGSAGTVFSIQFVAKKTGTGSVSFASAEVLANDGNGTNILSGTNPASVTVAAAPLVVPTEALPTTTQPIKKLLSSTSVATTSATTTVATTPTTTVPILSVGQKPGPSTAWLLSQVPLFLLAIIILLLLFWIWYLLTHRSRQRHKRTGGAHSLVHKEFGSLRDAVSSEVFKLEHAHTKRELGKEEEQFVKKMEKIIDTAEEKIEEEIERLA